MDAPVPPDEDRRAAGGLRRVAGSRERRRHRLGVVRNQLPATYDGCVPVDRSPDTEESVKAFMKTTLSQHEYPRVIEFVDELPKTPAGKVNRKALRDREAAKSVPNTSPNTPEKRA